MACQGSYSTPLRPQAGDQAVVEVSAGNVGDALARLIDIHQAMGGKLFDNATFVASSTFMSMTRTSATLNSFRRRSRMVMRLPSFPRLRRLISHGKRATRDRDRTSPLR